MSKRVNQELDRRPWRLLLWTVLAGLVFALIDVGELPEDYLRAARNSLHWHRASGNIVLVDVDDNALHQLGRLPWGRSMP